MPVDKPMDGGVVQIVVEDSSAPILNSIFHGSHKEDYNKWYGAESWIRGSKNGKYLHV